MKILKQIDLRLWMGNFSYSDFNGDDPGFQNTWKTIQNDPKHFEKWPSGVSEALKSSNQNSLIDVEYCRGAPNACSVCRREAQRFALTTRFAHMIGAKQQEAIPKGIVC